MLLAARRDVDGTLEPGDAVRSLLAEEARAGVVDPSVFAGLQYEVELRGKRLHDWLIAERWLGRKVLGYGAASRAVALLRQAGVDKTLLPAIVDASAAKQGLRMPGTDIPVVDTSQLAQEQPDTRCCYSSEIC